MLVRKSKIEEINDGLFYTVPLQKFSVFSGIKLSYLSRVRHNKVVISEAWYNKLLTHLTNFVNYDRIISGGDK